MKTGMTHHPRQRDVLTTESGQGPYGQFIVAGHHVLGADEAESLGGRDTGPDPYELVLAGLGACTAMTIRMYAARKGWALAKVEVRARHVKRAGADGVLSDRFERTVALTGALSAEQRARLVEVADRCPVSRTLRQGSEITVAEGAIQDADLTASNKTGRAPGGRAAENPPTGSAEAAPVGDQAAAM